MMRGDDLTALVTGGTAGIGRTIALSLAGEGYSIILSGRRPKGEVKGLLDSIIEAQRGKGVEGGCVYVRGDISKETTRRRLVGAVKRCGGRLKVLVNNAGVTTAGRVDMLDLKEDDFLKLLKINLVAPFLLSSSLAPSLSGGESPGYIVNISSISAYTASVNRADYCISKAGLSMMTNLFAERLADRNVRVFEVRPGIIKTGMTEPVRDKYDALIEGGLLPIRRWGEPEDVARAVLGIVKGYHPYSTGEVINVDGGFHIRRL
ncbi:MAG: 3-ketoacyl-ACP reductase [Deltaproteobacteria bacterium]|uniref:3-ketoacyl-ACP reductase n=1 Tax=Candidatus Zymogenus saltonus TaxID=2844893 RepID=A0A9D8PPN1_9DELT|nr:3-ketoacyl-ACP reductase [Candidatus Zymogenus saltonus]